MILAVSQVEQYKTINKQIYKINDDNNDNDKNINNNDNTISSNYRVGK